MNPADDNPQTVHALHTVAYVPEIWARQYGYCWREGYMTTTIEEITCSLCAGIVESCISVELGKAFPLITQGEESDQKN